MERFDCSKFSIYNVIRQACVLINSEVKLARSNDTLIKLPQQLLFFLASEVNLD